MQVRRDNFPAVFPHFKELLETCDFYAMDEEMTGINVPEVTESITFSPQDAYNSKRLAASRYSIIQVGVCLFRKVPSSSSSVAHYVAHPFNFLLFPQFKDDYTAEERAGDVVVSPSALAFLRKHGMDFQKWVYQGMAFCDGPREAALRARLAAQDEAKGTAPSSQVAAAAAAAATPLFTDAEKAWVEEGQKAAAALVSRVESSWAAAVSASAGRRPFLSSIEVAGGKEAVLPVQTSRAAREHLGVLLQRDFPQLSFRARRAGPSGYVVTLVMLSPEEVAKQAWLTGQRSERRLLDTLGFRLVFSELVRSKKPCVGHNCFADWLFLMHAMDGALPEQLPQWKERVRALFPRLWDTRYVASRQDLFPRGRFGSISLGGLYEAYVGASPHCMVELPLGFEGYDPMTLLGTSTAGGSGSDPAHEAGYDALMTGTVLLNLLAEAGYTLGTAPADLSNKIALFRSLYAVNVEEGHADEYMPEMGVLDMQHAPSIKAHHLESCLATQGVTDVAFYSVTDERTLGVLPTPSSAAAPVVTVETVVQRLAENCSSLLTAKAYVPPHLSSAPTSSAPPPSPATFPMPAVGAAGGFRCTMQRLMPRNPAAAFFRLRRL
ncbi:putative mitochondrial Poly(A)-specific ribonuclease PARN [Leptomonas pyrrhocoris]|uniref:Putative mitochondrial Poly(A)-specific ribonuclease PARN n=1 Tax=Leptomonas pyrrhocoris TaxID=157538 RepID=A0A0N0DYE1_LEPPY|nr:putative mitochondrial Poly(A)-specific ribonuclease PARN [Leptomonas pyrrhocoris]KPA84035.1 putative mitochondrial Poly(A)-specific ribonuclease PARN [Leptomonas pyrrhocoris]|eukprot:XP_015662474.1 putative mitochondrial Poly(A)-specific ribonuclease PARN [Leptomonas pyrrhocoris]